MTFYRITYWIIAGVGARDPARGASDEAFSTVGIGTMLVVHSFAFCAMFIYDDP